MNLAHVLGIESPRACIACNIYKAQDKKLSAKGRCYFQAVEEWLGVNIIMYSIQFVPTWQVSSRTRVRS